MKKYITIVPLILGIFSKECLAQQMERRTDQSTIIETYKREMVKRKAMDFTLTDMDGKRVSLSDFIGKVVVLDFWATWCKPCVGSFAGMQAVVNKYKDDSDVKFLFVDTWEQGENYKGEVRSFIISNKYNFHVLFDEMKDPAKSITSLYGVEGIPNKIIIDRNGFVRLQSAGSGRNVEQIVAEMSAKIEAVKIAD